MLLFYIFIWVSPVIWVTLCDDIFPQQLFLPTPLLLWRNDVNLIRINYDYNSYGSLGTVQQVLEIIFIIAIVI